MTRWTPFLVLAVATTGCLAELDDAADGDADAESPDKGDPTATKANRWDRESVLAADQMSGVGSSVALDGNTAVVGVRGSGVALVFERRSGQWVRSATLRGTGTAGDEFGTAVAVHGDTAVVGAHEDDSAGTDAGAIYVFTRSDGTWRRTAKVTAPDAARGDRFGISVAIDRNRIVAGADMDDAPDRPEAGAAYVFQPDGSDWRLDQKLVPDTRYARMHVGRSVAIDDRWIVLGAPSAVNGGCAYVFRRGPLGSRWHLRDELQAGGDRAVDFGHSVAVRGSTILVGDYQAGGGGAAYVFSLVDSDWTNRVPLAASDGEYEDGFGTSVALADGVAVVGASHADHGALENGAAYVFTPGADRWLQRQRLTTGDGDDGELFGFSVAASGDRVLVGAHGDRQPGSTGAAHVFVRE